MNNNKQMEQLVASSEALYASQDANHRETNNYLQAASMGSLVENTPAAYADTYSMTYNNEIGTTSNTVHVPSSNSGVTIGPGYDLAHRTEDEVLNDLMSIGLSEQDAILLSEGVGFTGEDAKMFNESIAGIINLSDEEQKELFNKVVPTYIDRAKKQYNQLDIDNKPDWNDLPDVVASLLVDYAYNAGVTTFPSFFKALIEGDRTNAEKEYLRYTTVGDKKVKLGRRNTDTKAILDSYDFKNLTEDLTNGK